MAPRDDLLDANKDGTKGGQANYGSTLMKSWWQQPQSTSTGSSSSTESNYGSYQSIPTTWKELEMDQVSQAKREGRRRLVYKLLQVLAVGALAWAAFDFFRGGAGREDDGFSYQYTDMNDTKVLPPAPVHHAHGKNKRKPLSEVHPVELGVPKFSRPKSSRPSEVLTHNKKTNKTKEEDDVHGRGGGPTHFPTNAWYQNMLLVNDGGGGPTEVNRVYSTPFLVDAVGPIPGLRLLPNQVSASTSVIQINDLVEYGLTVGAAPDATTTLKHDDHHDDHKRRGSSHQRKLKKQKHTATTTNTTEEHKSSNSTKSTNSSNPAPTTTSNETSTGDNKDDSGKNSTSTAARTYSNEYSVDRMTPLGLTLSWVRQPLWSL